MESEVVIPQNRVKRQKLMETAPLVHIPEEIIVEEILSRLPVRSLLRFKCVSKYWRSVISNPKFRYKTMFESILLINPKTQTVSLHKIVDGKVVNESSSFPILCNDDKYVCKKTCISNSCNGLFIVGIGESFFLFNPSIRYVVKVLELDCMRHNSVVVVGLVDDVSARDYKVVVRFTRRFNDEKVVVVASLKTKRWAQINFPFNIASTKAGPTLKGRMHWTVKAVDNNQYCPSKKIICFDPRTNTFEEFPSPQFKFGNENAIVGLGVSRGCISMVRKSGQTIQVLLMKKYGVRESWTVLTTINLLVPPFLFTNKGEIVGKRKNATEILAYNTIKNTCTDIYLSNPSNLLCGISFFQVLSSPVSCQWDERRHADRGWNISWLR